MTGPVCLEKTSSSYAALSRRYDSDAAEYFPKWTVYRPTREKLKWRKMLLLHGFRCRSTVAASIETLRSGSFYAHTDVLTQKFVGDCTSWWVAYYSPFKNEWKIITCRREILSSSACISPK